jgi:hypothetical protein
MIREVCGYLPSRPRNLLQQIVAQARHLVMQQVKSARQIMIGMGDTRQRQNALLEALDRTPGDVRFAEVGECFREEIELLLQRRARFSDGLNQRGKILRRDQVRVRAAQTEVRLNDLGLAQGVHLARTRRLIKKIGEVKEVERTGERSLGPRRTLGHESESPRLLRQRAHDEAGVAERHASHDKAADGVGFGHKGILDRRDMKD